MQGGISEDGTELRLNFRKDGSWTYFKEDGTICPTNADGVPITYLEDRIKTKQICETDVNGAIIPNSLGDYIYYVYDPELERIRIGHTANLLRRFRQLQNGKFEYTYSCKLVFLGYHNGTEMEEDCLHWEFRRFFITNDWYRPEKELIDYIQKVLNMTWNY